VDGSGWLRPRVEKGGARPSNVRNCLFFLYFQIQILLIAPNANLKWKMTFSKLDPKTKVV
jgi:hypothetical protein